MRHSPLLLASLAIVLTGCGGGTEDVADGPSPTPSPTGSVPTTPAPSATISTPPAHETAEQFIRRWQSVADAMQLSGETATFDDLNEPSCRSCAAFRAHITGIYAAGGHVEVRPTRIASIHELPNGTFHVRQEIDPSRYQERAGSAWKTFPGGEVTQVVELRHTKTGWRLAEYSQLAEAGL